MDTPTNRQQRRYSIDGALAGIRAILAALPGVADMNEDELIKVVREMKANTDLRPETQEVSARRFVKETLALARKIKLSDTGAK